MRESIVYAFTNHTIEGLDHYPWCEVCKEIIIQEDGFVSILAINSNHEYYGGVCGKCCDGDKEIAMSLFKIGFSFINRPVVLKPEVIEVEVELVPG